jgi:hypothetical protein
MNGSRSPAKAFTQLGLSGRDEMGNDKRACDNYGPSNKREPTSAVPTGCRSVGDLAAPLFKLHQLA